jgi:hypothetical protein
MLKKTKQFYKYNYERLKLPKHETKRHQEIHWKDIKLDEFNWKCEIAKK